MGRRLARGRFVGAIAVAVAAALARLDGAMRLLNRAGGTMMAGAAAAVATK
jgi:hypothetical protein